MNSLILNHANRDTNLDKIRFQTRQIAKENCIFKHESDLMWPSMTSEVL